MKINTGAYKTTNDNSVIFEPHLPSGIKSRIAPQMDISTKFVPDLASSPTDSNFDKDLLSVSARDIVLANKHTPPTERSSSLADVPDYKASTSSGGGLSAKIFDHL